VRELEEPNYAGEKPRYNSDLEATMKITVEISGSREQQLAEIARRLNVRVEDLAAAAVEDLLAQRDADFDAAAQRVLDKNRELYRRLSR
jgi:hypothetical protein